ncbi:MAG: amidase [Rhodospirillaceae bacterium]|nr:amidase [Rhodospirillaceae bacterium]
MDGKPLWQLGACDLAAAIAKGEATATDAVTASIERMRAVNGIINAVVDDLSDAALKTAAAHDTSFKQNGPLGPLHGVPVTIKENIDQKGHATPNGVDAFKGVIAPDDAPIVTNLTRAGAIVIGRTNTPEFSFRATTDNELHGRTMNPWNDWASAGGSSGGAAAAVMSGMGALGHGNDIGGSLRYPAAATGAVTVKPGLGRTPAYNPSATAERGLLAQLMSVQGVLAREAKDIRLAMQNLVNYDPSDPWMVPMPFDGPKLETPIKVAFTKNTFEFELHPAVDKALTTARDALADAGYEIVETEPPLLRETAREANRCLFGETIAMLGPDIRTHGSETVQRIFENYAEYFEPYEGHDLLLGMAKRAHYARAWTTFLAEYPLVLTPFLPHPTYAWDRDAQGLEGVIEVLGAGIYSYSMNYMGLPAGIISANANDGLPVGVQIVGQRFREDLIIDACEAVEDRVGVMAEILFGREAAN